MSNLLRTAASAGVLTGSAIAARRGVPAWDSAAFSDINGLPDALQYPLWVPMQFGSLGGALTAGAFVGLTRNRRLGTEVAVAGTVAWIAAKAIKALVQRDRPAAEVATTELRIGAADSGLGFPSGHAAVATTTSALIARGTDGHVNAAAAFVSALVGVSRIHVGAHYPLDVVGGWALGALVADLTSAAFAHGLERDHAGVGSLVPC